MGILVREDNVFILETKNTHYVFGIDEAGCNRHIHWGAKCAPEDYEMERIGDESSHNTRLDEIAQEYTVFGSTMYRECALKGTFADGCREIDPVYRGYRSDGTQLELRFADAWYPLEFSLFYRVDDESDIITRWVELHNAGGGDIVFEKLFSAELTLPSQEPYCFANTNGSWGAEFIEAKQVLEGGSLSFESRSGVSGHTRYPGFIASQLADEDTGAVFFASLAYSGSFKVTATRDVYRRTRVLLGVNDFDFAWRLKADERFTLPEVYCGLTQGFGEMSRQMNRFALEHILPEPFARAPLPVLYNSWEATWFRVNSENQCALAERAAQIGVELFVMDDGWFGERNDDHAGLGDWVVNRKKFPNGLTELIERVNSLGMDFGLWVEPEMVNPDSDLYRAHPDWVYHYPHRKAHELRHQLVLNMTRKDVQDYIYAALDTLLTENAIKYLKWDMNRALSETGAENLEEPKMLWYLHTDAVYKLVDRLKKNHPDVAIESCCSGGGRSDLGALRHFDMVWTSDNTDAVDRMTIQKGFTLLRPVKAMRAWVTDIGGNNKPCSLDFRFAVAMQGSLGVGGDLLKYSEEELEICKKNIALYKEIRDLVQFGDLYRILDVDRDEVQLNQYVSPDRTRSVAFLLAKGTRFFKKRQTVLLKGLLPEARYRLTVRGQTYEKSGAYLANVGLSLHIRGKDFCEIIRIEQI